MSDWVGIGVTAVLNDEALNAEDRAFLEACKMNLRPHDMTRSTETQNGSMPEARYARGV